MNQMIAENRKINMPKIMVINDTANPLATIVGDISFACEIAIIANCNPQKCARKPTTKLTPPQKIIALMPFSRWLGSDILLPKRSIAFFIDKMIMLIAIMSNSHIKTPPLKNNDNMIASNFKIVEYFCLVY